MMTLFPNLSVLKPGKRNFNQVKAGKSRKASSKTGTISPLTRTGGGKVSGKGVGGSQGQAGAGTTVKTGLTIKGGKNGGF